MAREDRCDACGAIVNSQAYTGIQRPDEDDCIDRRTRVRVDRNGAVETFAISVPLTKAEWEGLKASSSDGFFGESPEEVGEYVGVLIRRELLRESFAPPAS